MPESVASEAQPKVILIRLDKIGDLLCSFPIDQIFAPGCHTQWVVAEGLAILGQMTEPRRNCFEISLKKPSGFWPWRHSCQKLVTHLKAEKPDAVVIFFAPWWVALACWLAKVPKRAGRRSQVLSFLLLTRGLRQSRSLAQQHEAEYNADLIRQGLPEYLPAVGSPLPRTRLRSPSQPELLEKLQLQAKNYFVVHPGMFGSALNWPQKNYVSLIQELSRSHPVVVTGTAQDAAYLSEIQPALQPAKDVRWLVGQLNLSQLLAVLENAKAVLAPSTGVAHLAAALGTKVVGFYSPVRVHHPRRWSPRGSQVTVLLPDVNCPATTQCLGSQCLSFPCMERITVADAVKATVTATVP